MWYCFIYIVLMSNDIKDNLLVTLTFMLKIALYLQGGDSISYTNNITIL